MTGECERIDASTVRCGGVVHRGGETYSDPHQAAEHAKSANGKISRVDGGLFGTDGYRVWKPAGKAPRAPSRSRSSRTTGPR
jgi:hypothetical protein